MKCPYRKESTTNIIGQTMESFGECYGNECPFYAKTVKGGQTTQITHICKRANKESEVTK